LGADRPRLAQRLCQKRAPDRQESRPLRCADRRQRGSRAMFERIRVSARRPFRLSAMHPAPPIAHGRRAARTTPSRLGSAARGPVQGGSVSNHFKHLHQVHGVDRKGLRNFCAMRGGIGVENAGEKVENAGAKVENMGVRGDGRRKHARNFDVCAFPSIPACRRTARRADHAGQKWGGENCPKVSWAW
jgi:hypothetical protein